MLDIKGKKIAVLCDTKEKVREFYKAINYKGDRDVFNCDYPKRLYIEFDIGGDLTWDSYDYFQRNNYKLITFDEFMNGKVEIKKEEKKVNKFKVGDIVRIIGNKKSGHGFNVGEIVTITGICNKGRKDEHCRAIGKSGRQWYVDYVDIRLENKSSTKTITITTSDTITTLTDGSHTTTINRFYKDTNNEKVAVAYVVKKYYDELDEIERLSRMPKVGDNVKVVDSGRTFSTYNTWLIKNKIDIKYAIKWTTSKSPKNNSIYKIVAIHKHLDSRAMLALIEDDYNCYIINVEGLEVVK